MSNSNSLNQINKIKKKVSVLKKFLVGLFLLISIGFGAAYNMLTEIEQDLINAETMIKADHYMGGEKLE